MQRSLFQGLKIGKRKSDKSGGEAALDTGICLNSTFDPFRLTPFRVGNEGDMGYTLSKDIGNTFIV